MANPNPNLPNSKPRLVATISSLPSALQALSQPIFHGRLDLWAHTGSELQGFINGHMSKSVKPAWVLISRSTTKAAHQTGGENLEMGRTWLALKECDRTKYRLQNTAQPLLLLQFPFLQGSGAGGAVWASGSASSPNCLGWVILTLGLSLLTCRIRVTAAPAAQGQGCERNLLTDIFQTQKSSGGIRSRNRHR